MDILSDLEIRSLVQDKIRSWTDADKEQLRIDYSEYRNAMGPEADKSFDEFACQRAAMSVYYTLMKEGKVA